MKGIDEKAPIVIKYFERYLGRTAQKNQLTTIETMGIIRDYIEAQTK